MSLNYEYTTNLSSPSPSGYISGDHVGAFIVSVVYLNSGSPVIPTGGSVLLEWSQDGDNWVQFAGGVLDPTASFGSPTANGVVRYMRASGTATGADSIRVVVWMNRIGVPGIPSNLLSQLLTGQRVRTIPLNQREAVVTEGDGYRVYAPFGVKTNLADKGDSLPSIPANGSVWLGVFYSEEKATILLSRRLAVYSGGGLRYVAYSPTVSLTKTGTQLTVRKLNLASPKVNDIELWYLGTTTPTQFDTSIEADYAIIPDTGGGGGNSGGGLIDSDQFLIIPPGSQTLVQIYNPHNTTIIARFELQIAELNL